MPDYSQIDASPLLGFLFFPRKYFTPCPQGAFDLIVPVDEGITISCRFYAGEKKGPWILYFHGNGEVVSDFDEIAPFYHQKGINLVVADYRGYGSSGGSPTFTNLVGDAHRIFMAVEEELAEKDFLPILWMMGRSLGSISALEIAYHYPDKIKGLVIESGFASVARLIKHLGLPADGIDLESLDQERIRLIRGISIPALVLHGEFDMLVPLQEAKDLFAYLGTKEKKLLIIPEADHNNIMFIGLEQYFEAIQKFIEETMDF